MWRMTMANAKSHSSPRFIGVNDKPYVVRVEVYEPGEDGVILSKDIEKFERAGDAVTFAQKVWRKFSVK
jgi:hypothetical protein